MVQRQVFSAGFKPLASDFTAIGLNRQAAFKLLLSAFSGDASAVLFDAIAPTVSENGTVYTITTPAQLVSIEGALAQSSEYVESFDTDNGAGGQNDLYVYVFFVVRQTPVTDTRNFLSTVPATGAQILQNLTVEVAQRYTVEVVYLSSLTANTTLVPILDSDAIGYVKLADFVAQPGNPVEVTVNQVPKFALPGGSSSSLPAHGDTHITGQDRIPDAVLSDTNPNGSTVGLMPEGALATAYSSVQGIVPAGTSPFLSFASTPDESGRGKQVIAELSADNSLTTGSDAKLGLNFLAASDLNGSSSRPARSDHTHPLSETGMLVINQSLAVSLSSLGDVRSFTASPTDTTIEVERILDVAIYWEPNNVKSEEYIRLAAPWSTVIQSGLGVQTLGARAMITGSNTFKLEIGSVGITYLTQEMQNTISPLVNGGYNGSNIPTDGTLHMVITALRKGTDG